MLTAKYSHFLLWTLMGVGVYTMSNKRTSEAKQKIYIVLMMMMMNMILFEGTLLEHAPAPT